MHCFRNLENKYDVFMILLKHISDINEMKTPLLRHTTETKKKNSFIFQTN